jgi:hypothetical protein
VKLASKPDLAFKPEWRWRGFRNQRLNIESQAAPIPIAIEYGKVWLLTFVALASVQDDSHHEAISSK